MSLTLSEPLTYMLGHAGHVLKKTTHPTRENNKAKNSFTFVEPGFAPKHDLHDLVKDSR